MAELYTTTKAGKRYQVRSAGQSVRLYTNGVFHSQYNFKRAFAGHIWDLLALPVVACGQHAPLKILVLGLGGGAVIHQLHGLCDRCEITAIELDDTHIKIAKLYFKVGSSLARLVHADARAWLNSNAQKFDLIIDDLFADDGEHPTQPTRAIRITTDWLKCLNAHLSPTGVLVFNTESAAQIKALIGYAAKAKPSFKSLLQLTLANYQNAVAVLTRKQLRAGDFRQRLEAVPAKLPRPSGKLAYKISDRSGLLARHPL